ncbi:MAG TPA: hypothetical protein VMQ65_09420 [Candidatus Limnocylindria bacterium]|nr:hypothetical protein [Candidatus Limnocylindria bacterium]
MYAMLAPGAEAVAVRAHDVALGYFGQELRSALQGSSARAQRELFSARVAMVEVHLMAGEAAATVEARDLSELAEEGRRGCLPIRDPLDFAFPVRGVVGDVCPSLVAALGHGQL